MARKAHVVLYQDKDDNVFIDAVFTQGQRFEADKRVDDLNDYKWIKRAWSCGPEMNATDMDIPIRIAI